MLIAAIALAAQTQVALPAVHRRRSEPAVTCGITIVSHKFVGRPGIRFTYAGDEYQLPAGGRLELIASPGDDTYEIDGRPRPLNVWPRDEFGTETVPLPVE
jgi:hypothetical protein